MTSLHGLVRQLLLTIIGSVVLTGLGYGAQPPDVVVSDSIANTGMGTNALLSLSTGNSNTASGSDALISNTTGWDNTASGASALYSNITGISNSAFGFAALGSNTSGGSNTVSGAAALNYNQTGSYNTAMGYQAMLLNVTGSNNIAVGAFAGYNVRGGHYNIEVGNTGTANDVGTIRIGKSGQQTSAYIAGISSAQVTGSAVYITSTGQLGVLASSERYKTDVASMGSSSEKVRELRPVTFHLKTDPKAGIQYGLIAEEVARVYPELVIRGDKGQIEGVRYEELTPMLLNEVQQQQRTIAAQGRQLRRQLHDMQQQLAELQEFRRSMQGRAANQ